MNTKKLQILNSKIFCPHKPIIARIEQIDGLYDKDSQTTYIILYCETKLSNVFTNLEISYLAENTQTETMVAIKLFPSEFPELIKDIYQYGYTQVVNSFIYLYLDENHQREKTIEVVDSKHPIEYYRVCILDHKTEKYYGNMLIGFHLSTDNAIMQTQSIKEVKHNKTKRSLDMPNTINCYI